MYIPLADRTLGEIYRRFIRNLESFQTVRAVDTGELVPEIDRGEMYTYQLRVYNLSKSTPITNCRAKLRLRGGSGPFRPKVRTDLCWSPSKGTVTINREDHEWLNLATIKSAPEGEIWGKSYPAEMIFPTESGLLNPATVELSPWNPEEERYDKDQSITRTSLPIFYSRGFYGNDNLRVSSSNHPIRRYDLNITPMDSGIYLSVNTHRKGWIEQSMQHIFNLSDDGVGERIGFDRLSKP